MKALLGRLGMSGCLLGALLTVSTTSAAELVILKPEAFRHHIERFNAMEDENLTNHVSNAASWDWLRTNVPFFACPDREVEEIYWFRWWSFRKHLKHTSDGFVLTEFIVPMKHGGEHGTISSAVGHHIDEGRWLRDGRYLDDYIRFWLRGHDGKPEPKFHRFSSWFAAAVWKRYLVNGDREFVLGLLDELVADHRRWEAERQLPDGLFWQYDVQDAMEESISGSRTAQQARPTINSYQFANARAIAAIARLAGRETVAAEFEAKAATLKRLVEEQLWNPASGFFEVRGTNGAFAGVREAIGFIPWQFDLPQPGRGYETAWSQLTNTHGFWAPFGLTTAERRHPEFRSHGCCGCEWDGAVWPFATSQTLGALANVLRNHAGSKNPSLPMNAPTPAPSLEGAGVGSGSQSTNQLRGLPISSSDHFAAFMAYVRSHRFDGKPYIGEYLDETTGQWLKGRQERSRYYNHSTFADLVISDLVGLRPRADGIVEVQPLLPVGTWDWFCLDGVPYHGRTLTVIWDKDGSRYGRGAGLQVLVDGKVIARSPRLERVEGRLE